MTDELKVADVDTADKVKAGLAVVLVIAGVVGYYALAAQPIWVRWLAVAAGLALGALTVGFSRYGTQFRQFVELARIELRKIVWPTRDETLKTTAVVLVFVLVAGLFFWGLDLVLAWATKTITGTGG